MNAQMIITRRTFRSRRAVDVADLWAASRERGAVCPGSCGLNLALLVYPRSYQFRCARCAWSSELFVVMNGVATSAAHETIPPPRPI